MLASPRNTLFALPFIVCNLLAILVTLFSFLYTPPHSFTLVLAIIVGVLLAGTYQFRLGTSASAPTVGAGVVVLAIATASDNPFFWTGIWAIGFTLSQILLRRKVFYALYTSGLGGVAANVSVLVCTGLEALSIWPAAALIITTVLYFTIVIGAETLRVRLTSPVGVVDYLANISLRRLLTIAVVLAATSIVMLFIDSSLVGLLQSNADNDRSPTVVLSTALIFFALAQRQKSLDTTAQLNTVLEAAVELPHATGTAFADTLTLRACEVVHATDAALRSKPPQGNEIGAQVLLAPGTESGKPMWLVAGTKITGSPFTREDQLALTTLAGAADHAAEMQFRVASLEHRANTDTLTGLPNYGAFQRALADANSNRNYHDSIALLFLDLDNFKTLNDNHGHQAGDQLLQAVAERLQDTAGGGNFVSRVGGDEFVVIFKGLDTLEQAKETAEQVIHAVGQPLRLEGLDMRPVVSAGLSFSSHRELNPQTLVEDADRTMLKEKRSRRDSGITEISSLSIASHRSTRTNEIVERAIRENRLTLAFQPIVNVCDQSVWGYEALVRYMDPEIGPISPPSLVARAKSLGLMNELTQQIITKALAAAEEFSLIDASVNCITVNLELNQISSSQLGSFIHTAIAAYPNISLCIELNEGSLRTATSDLRSDAQRLQAAGVIIALDDYGSDDSSVRALIDFPMDVLKLDKSLISDLGDSRQLELVKALQQFGDTLNVVTIVEGVETEEAARTLEEIGVRNAQGYFYGKPIPAARVRDQLKRTAANRRAQNAITPEQP